MQYLCRQPGNHAEKVKLRAVAHARQQLQCLLRFEAEAAQFVNHKVDHIVSMALRADAVYIPGPFPLVIVECQQTLVDKRRDELNGKKWIARRLVMDELRQCGGIFRSAAKAISDQLCQIVTGQRREHDLLYARSGLPDCLQLAHQRMRCSDFVIAVSSDKEKIAEVGLAHQLLQQVERCCVEPLQIIEEERQGMFRPCEDAYEQPKHSLEAPLRILPRKLGYRRWLSDEELQFRNEIHHQSRVRSQRLS